MSGKLPIPFSTNDYVWVKPDGQDPFLLPWAGKVVSRNEDSVKVLNDNGEEKTVAASSVLGPLYTAIIDSVEDMITLNDLQERTLLRNIQLRYNKNQIYTYIGWILISVNPYKELDIYTKKNVLLYKNRRIGELPPHIYAIGAQSFMNYQQNDQSQCIIISGETGAGKTESTKLLINFLASLGERTSISEQIIKANPIIEAFGNAKTTKNDNSSRFGKYIEIYFGRNGQMEGASIYHYLLEKSRIKGQNFGDRNYHIFYCMLNGLSQKERNTLNLGSSNHFSYLNNGSLECGGRNEQKGFLSLKESMQTLNFREDEIWNIFKLLAAILHIGNLTYTSTTIDHIDAAYVSECDHLNNAVSLFGVDKNDFVEALTHKTIFVEGNKVVSNVSKEQATVNRDGFCMALYDHIFSHIMKQINKTISNQVNTVRSYIGILDIFGFENFAVNSFEQLCINFANEHLQQFFVQHIFKLEQEEYHKEGIEWRNLDFTDNQNVLKLIGGKQINIMTLIDEQTKFPRGSDNGFIVKCSQCFSNDSSYIPSKSEMSLEFGIKHYAGDVIYKVEGFIEKNRNTISSDWLDVISNSGNNFLKDLFTKELSNLTKPNKSSLVIQYKVSLEMLMAALSSCQPFFIRCIKPNHQKKSNIFNHPLCCQQLQYLGIMETANIRRIGYPIRHNYLNFIEQYNILLKQSSRTEKKNDSKTVAKLICQKVLGHKDYQLGISKVFLKAAHSNILENEKNKIVTNSAILLQKNIRGFLCRRRYNKLRNAAITLQKYWRGRKPRQDFMAMKIAYMRLQASIRSRQCTRIFKKIRKSLIPFQARCRGYLVRKLGLKKMPPKPKQKKTESDSDYGWITIMFDDALDNSASTTNDTEILQLDVAKGVNVKDTLNRGATTFKQYAAANFNTKVGYSFTSELLMYPLLDLNSIMDQMAAVTLWETIQRFMGDAPEPQGKFEQNEKSVMNQLNDMIAKSNQGSNNYVEAMKLLEDQETKRSSAQLVEGPKKLVNLTLIHRNKLQSEIRRVHLQGEALKRSYDEWLKKKSTVLEKLHFIIGHGILRPELRDEIYCQLCKQLTENPDHSSNINGWILMSLCAGCFSPSDKFTPTLLNFMASNNNKLNCLSKLQRTIVNGVRNQPPSYFELNALLKQEPMVLHVHLIDDTRVVSVEVDSATTSGEICTQLFTNIKLKDNFGFSLFIAFQKREVSLESGACHVMDAICQCEQHAKENGIPEFKAPWRFLFRKEMFAPWQGLKTENDPVGSHLVYYQIMEGVRHGQYKCADEKELALLIAQHYYITYGKKLLPEIMTELIHELIPDPIIKQKSLAYWGQLISDTFHKSCFYKCKQSDESVKSDVILYAKNTWPLYLSKYYEMIQVSGMRLELTSLLLAINSYGLYFAKNTTEVVMKYSYVEIITIKEGSSNGTDRDLLKIILSDGHKFVFKTPYAEVISILVNYIIEELKKHSSYAIAISDYVRPNDSFLSLAKGDMISLAVGYDLNSEWLRGSKIKTGDEGEFPSRMVIILPTLKKPPVPILQNYADSLCNNYKTLKKPVLDLKKHTLENYAAKSLRGEQAVIGQRKSWMNLSSNTNKDDIWKHTKSPLHLPLHPQLQRIPFNNLATGMFSAILNYMGDKHLDKSHFTRPIFEPPLTNDCLRDELYCQLMKQLTNNPNPESERKGWELLWLAVGLYSCSNELLEELRMFLKTRPLVVCQEILGRLEKTVQEGPRSFLHHWLEIESVQKSTPLTHSVHFPNGMEQIFPVESATRVNELAEEVKQWLGLQENIGFSLIVARGDNSISLANNEFLLDAIQDACYKCTPDFELSSRGETPHLQYSLMFVKKLWITTIPGKDKKADVVCHYNQEIMKYLSGYHSCTASEMVDIGAMILATEDDVAQNDLEKTISKNIDALIPSTMLKNKINYDWARRIKHAYLKNTGMTTEEAKIAFLKHIEKLPTFGSAFFDVQEACSRKNPIPKDFILGINRNGILIINCNTQDITRTINYKDIINSSCTNNSFRIQTYNEEITWLTDCGYKMTDLVNSYLSIYNDLMIYYR